MMIVMAIILMNIIMMINLGYKELIILKQLDQQAV